MAEKLKIEPVGRGGSCAEKDLPDAHHSGNIKAKGQQRTRRINPPRRLIKLNKGEWVILPSPYLLPTSASSSPIYPNCVSPFWLNVLLLYHSEGRGTIFKYNADAVDNFALSTSQVEKKNAGIGSYLSHHPRPNQESNLDDVSHANEEWLVYLPVNYVDLHIRSICKADFIKISSIPT